MKWSEFRDLLIGISPDTALGRIVSIRAETDPERIKHFSRGQYQVWSEWRQRKAGQVSDQEMQQILEGIKQAFIDMAGGGNH